MRVSFIIPAYNEEKRLGACLASLVETLHDWKRPGQPPEIIVVDNNSTDRTASIARRAGATVVFEPINQIARARNSGAKAATGQWLVFIDADTLVTAGTLQELATHLDPTRIIGGGTLLRYDRTPALWRFFVTTANLLIPWLGWTPGCFVFCQAAAFREIGGFDQQLFAGEDAEFGKAMRRWSKRHGLRMAFIKTHRPITSVRKLDLYGTFEILRLIIRWLIFQKRVGRDKSKLDVFYDGRR